MAAEDTQKAIETKKKISDARAKREAEDAQSDIEHQALITQLDKKREEREEQEKKQKEKQEEKQIKEQRKSERLEQQRKKKNEEKIIKKKNEEKQKEINLLDTLQQRLRAEVEDLTKTTQELMIAKKSKSTKQQIDNLTQKVNKKQEKYNKTNKELEEQQRKVEEQQRNMCNFLKNRSIHLLLTDIAKFEQNANTIQNVYYDPIHLVNFYVNDIKQCISVSNIDFTDTFIRLFIENPSQIIINEENFKDMSYKIIIHLNNGEIYEFNKNSILIVNN
jgi:chromosome segregation ATPase